MSLPFDLEGIAFAVERNRIVSGTPGPLFNFGWDAGCKASARFIRDRAAAIASQEKWKSVDHILSSVQLNGTD